MGAFRANIEQLDKMYDDISIVILSDGKVVYGEKTENKNIKNENRTPAKEKGFFEKILSFFGKKDS